VWIPNFNKLTSKAVKKQFGAVFKTWKHKFEDDLLFGLEAISGGYKYLACYSLDDISICCNNNSCLALAGY